jgi:hypothetical protein
MKYLLESNCPYDLVEQINVEESNGATFLELLLKGVGSSTKNNDLTIYENNYLALMEKKRRGIFKKR